MLLVSLIISLSILCKVAFVNFLLNQHDDDDDLMLVVWPVTRASVTG